MTYSSGYFKQEEISLKAAQLNKFQLALEGINQEGSLLEVGCGWGGFSRFAAQRGYDVTGITISAEQKRFSDSIAGNACCIQLKDYRDLNEKFDNIVSIEMIEAVGERYWRSYFSKIKKSLNPSGKFVLQAIIVPDNVFQKYRKSSDFIRHYTFPGGMLLSLEEIRKVSGSVGLVSTKVFDLRESYARTCRIWLKNMTSNRAKIEKLGFEKEFFRAWKFYLALCVAGFSEGTISAKQIYFEQR